MLCSVLVSVKVVQPGSMSLQPAEMLHVGNVGEHGQLVVLRHLGAHYSDDEVSVVLDGSHATATVPLQHLGLCNIQSCEEQINNTFSGLSLQKGVSKRDF